MAETQEPPDLTGDRAYLWDIYDNEARETVIRKANQVGITAWALLRSIWGTTFLWPKGSAYFLPHGASVGDFVRQKVDPAVNALPPDLAPEKTDNVGMKGMNMGDFFIRGIASEANRQTISVDDVKFDERDMMLQHEVDDVLQRLEDSKFKIVSEIGRPSSPNYGIDGRFQESSMQFWHLKCEGCNKDWIIEESWPECITGKVAKLCCPKCKKLTLPWYGRWVAHRESDIMGFSVNGILNPNADLDKLMERYEKKLGVFLRANMGVPYVEEGAGVRMTALLGANCDAGRAMAESDPGPTWMGSDVGDVGHAVINKGTPEKPITIKVFRWRDWNELDAAMRKYHVACAVVDALPDKRNAREFCRRFRGRAFMNFYDQNRRGSPRWDDKEMTLNMDRTESLDTSHTPLYTGQGRLPKEDPEVREFCRHAENLIRINDELPNGSVIARWVNRGADHYRHGYNYSIAAMSRVMFRTVTG